MWTETTRPQYRREGLRYASDMTDAEWALIEPHMPAAQAAGAAAENVQLRGVVEASAVYAADRLPVASVAARVSAVRRCSTISTPGATTGSVAADQFPADAKPAKRRAARPARRPG